MRGVTFPLLSAQKLVDARRTLALARSAKRRGDTRLAASRALTAAVQATVARHEGKSEADEIIQVARHLIQSIVLEKLAHRRRTR